MWLLKLSFDENPIMINHKSNGDFNNIIFFFFFDMSTQEGGGGFELVTSTLISVIPADSN
jgi:hypothetical protein